MTIHRPKVSTLPSRAFIRVDLIAATRGPFIFSLITCLNEGTRLGCRNIGSMDCNFTVTFIKSFNQSSIKPCLIVHLVALRTLI